MKRALAILILILSNYLYAELPEGCDAELPKTIDQVNPYNHKVLCATQNIEDADWNFLSANVVIDLKGKTISVKDISAVFGASITIQNGKLEFTHDQASDKYPAIRGHESTLILNNMTLRQFGDDQKSMIVFGGNFVSIANSKIFTESNTFLGVNDIRQVNFYHNTIVGGREYYRNNSVALGLADVQFALITDNVFVNWKTAVKANICYLDRPCEAFVERNIFSRVRVLLDSDYGRQSENSQFYESQYFE
ncbi:hypothetical protein [Pleionea sp. CnH1-48]|uniref:hypothetical protein n=1 Tax=Pleionea sp. CnH1-48 TaxID=2954494 RepID=UPI002096E3C1|nr:hypothetical protein [Pleionea sp. CnH1-48]MCO7226948.1 hypothetical protein [Pleionea sp. CnH1-48]